MFLLVYCPYSSTDVDLRKIDSERVLVFQKPGGSGEFANSSLGVPVGQGLHLERDSDDRPMCDFIVANDAAFVH
jgi:hypothetical protein